MPFRFRDDLSNPSRVGLALPMPCLAELRPGRRRRRLKKVRRRRIYLFYHYVMSPERHLCIHRRFKGSPAAAVESRVLIVGFRITARVSEALLGRAKYPWQMPAAGGRPPPAGAKCPPQAIFFFGADMAPMDTIFLKALICH